MNPNYSGFFVVKTGIYCLKKVLLTVKINNRKNSGIAPENGS